ncbi:Fur family transcriptional regulator [Actomonas aquatica]|uniref:Fur family transcriptional regulator n=1 Tax=Actomonas aquatica TaxID=2866162 RepID=A0ABZ1CC97_9BACT|nr:Fur family transcriptional regulator [Opitutus sp. WL0086]WRQ89196.1 Fur family transcriptional regulator [Opitutus sp. WL0086]
MPVSQTQHIVPAERLSAAGLRPTPQRETVYEVLLNKRDHPTADEVYVRVKEAMPSISLATVYNCLEALVQHELVRAVNFERAPTRYCPNLVPHAHFHDEEGRTLDVDLPTPLLEQLRALLPNGYTAKHIEINFHGRAPLS